MAILEPCKEISGGINTLYIFHAGDFKKNEAGELVLKRKYGKFTREGYKYEIE